MKRVIPTLLLSGCTLGAAAQSPGVSVFGVLDLAARFSDNGSSRLKSLESGGMSASRFGVQGVEDLGDGLKAAFWLEAGFAADTGTSSTYTDMARFWGRRATLSLISQSWGELRMGRNQTPFFNMYLSFDPFTCNGVGSVMNLIPVLGTRISPASGVGQQDQARGRTDNSVQLGLPPNAAGLYGEVLASAGEGVSGNRHQGLRLGMANGAYNIAASAGWTQVYTVTRPDNRVRELGVAGSYEFGAVKLIAQVLDRRLDNYTGRLFVLSGTWRVGAGYFRGTASRHHTPLRTPTGWSQDARQLSLGYVHGLSKRTSLYATFNSIHNDAGAAFRGSSLPAVAGQPSRAIEMGLRHGF